MAPLEQQWVKVQQKTFTKWLNSKLKIREVQINDLIIDLSDGIILIHLLEILSNESLGRYASRPKLRVQKFENVNKSLDFIRSRRIQLTNTGAEDVVDGNSKIILGLIWTLILRFTISDINEEGLSAKEGLLLWCQRKTACYDEVEVRDFSTSWNDGLAFCALLDIHRPDLIDYDSLDKSDHRGNMQLAFDIASKEIGIPDLLDVEDVCDVAKPDERSLMTYIAYWFHAFSQMERVENAGRRVEKFVQSFAQVVRGIKMEVLDAKGLSERLRWEDNEYWLHLEAETPFEKYPAKQHARRVQEKLGVEEGLIYLPGQPARNNEDSDMPAPFRQRRYFYYLSGCNEPDCHLTYDTRRDELCLFIPRIKPERVIWNGRGSTLAEALVKYDVDQVFYADELEYAVQGWAIGNRQASIYTMHQSSQFPGCENLKPRIDSTALQPAMNICRMIKDDHEIKLIRKANDISSQAHREVLANIAKFKNEAQVEGLFMDVCISHQAKQQAYDPIAASGPNAGTLHYDANNEDLAGRQLMCLDAGCEYELYASDITRSFPLSASWPSKEAENIYKLVQRMQETCIKRLEPGVRYLDLHIMAHQIAIDGLLQLGILHNGTKEEIYKAGTSRAFFPHGLGHHIGLEVHDVGQAQLMSVRRGKPVYQQAPSLYPQNFHIPVYDPETCRAPSDPQSSHLEEGMVVTVEPGIYFSVYALQHFYLPSPIHRNFINVEVLERYMPVGGVRIEDDILITSCGYENLTKAPKGDAMLEIIRHGKSGTIDLPAPNLAPQRRLSGHVEQPMRRAPGISKKTPSQHLQKPLARATTLPADFKQQHDMHVESFAGPSILANFSHSMSTEEKIQQWQRKRNSGETVSCPSTNTKKLQPVCGEISSNVQHVYMGNASSLTSSSRPSREFESTPMCKNCAILVQTLDRLRQNLTNSTHRFPEPEAKHIVKPDLGTKHTTLSYDEVPSAAPQIDELSVGASACTINLDKRQRITLPPPRSMLVRPSETREVHRIRRCDTAPLSCKVQAQVPSGQVPRPHAQREQSANNANPDSWRHQTLTATTLPTSAKGCDSKRLPKTLPSAEPLEAEATRQKLESLQLRLHCLEEGARVKRQQQDQAALPDRFLASRPSMPVLASHNPWQQHSAQSLPVGRRGLTNRRSTNIEDHDIARYQQGRYEEGDHQRRFERDALMRDTFFLR